jgi:hypothetical protein
LIDIDVTDWRQFHRILVRIKDLPGTIWVRRQAEQDTELDTSKTKARRSARSPSAKPIKRSTKPAFSWRFLGR